MITSRDAGLVLPVLVLLLVSVPVVAQGQTASDVKVLGAIADSVVAEGSGANFGWAFELNVWERGGDDRWVFLMFDLGQIPAGSTALEARLKLFTRTVGTLYPNPAIGVHYCPSNDWTEEGINYNNMPSYEATPLDAVNVTEERELYRWNVTAAAQTALNAHDRRLSLVVKAETNGTVSFASRQAPGEPPPVPDVHPQLTISYEAPSPSDNQLIVTALIVVAVAAAASTGIGLTYWRLRKRKQPVPQERSSK